MVEGFPWWTSAEDRFHPWSGKIPHPSGQLNLCATTHEAVLWSLGAVIRESPRSAVKTQHSQKERENTVEGMQHRF